MAGQQQCYLDHILQHTRSWTLDEMVAIERHVSSGTCPNRAHHSFKDLMRRDGGLDYYTTPLLHACMEGCFLGVQRFIEVWRVDVDAAASLFFYPSSVKRIGLETDRLHGVTPLCAAALKNDVELVRYLVGKGANVSARTSTDNKGPFAGITPLHAALLHLAYGFKSKEAKSLDQTDIIRILLEHGADPSALSTDGTPTWMFGWIRFYKKNHDFSDIGLSNVSAISLLLEYGMSIDQRCPRLGRTLLHHMAGPVNKLDKAEIVELLFEKGADFRVRDKEGITPIMSAAIGNNAKPNMRVLKLFTEKDDIPNMEKIEALEVAAALLLSHHFSDVAGMKYCLSQAQELRYIEGITLIPKTPANERAVEWATSSDVENIQQRQTELEMQSILIRLRIFSAFGWGAIYRYLWPYIKNKNFLTGGDLYRDGSQYLQHYSHQELTELLDISLTMLETIRRFAPTSDVEEIILVIGTIVPKFADTLLALKKKNDPLFNVETLKTSFELLSTTLQALVQAQLNCGNDNPPLNTIYGLGKMFSFLVGIPDDMTQPISDYLKEIVNLNNQVSYQEKLITFACGREVFYIEDQDVTRGFYVLRSDASLGKIDSENTLVFFGLLLRFGADPDAVDDNGNGPLHRLAAKPNGNTSAIARLLLNAGAHLDRTNKNGLTTADVWKQEKQQERKRRRGEDQPAGERQEFPEWLREDVLRLMCLSARIIRSHRIPYLKVLPPSLQSFVSFH